MVLFVAVVCATPAVESLGSCREGAGSIPAVRVAALPKRRLAAGARLQRMRPPRHAAGVQDSLQEPGCSECAPLATLPGFKTRKRRALPEGAVVRFCGARVGGRGFGGVLPEKARRTARCRCPWTRWPRVLL